MIRQLEATPMWDICIVGGGATGLGIAVDAASRGFKTLLVEKFDFAKGTSSRSTKLVHGGVRYLQQGNIKLVMDALKERGILIKNAPHLVKNQAFIVPNYKWWEGPFYGIGLKVYDWMAGSLGFGPSQFLSREETLNLAPTLDADGLRSGVLYHDGQFDDARLAIHLAMTAADHGATIINYMSVEGLLKANNKVCGVLLKDKLNGVSSSPSYEVKAKAVINATGTWTRPFWPIYPGRSTFLGRQLHVADYVSAEEFRGKHVIVVGGGISAVGLLDEISQVTTTSWFTRREPEWRDATFDARAGHDAVALVEERVRRGLPPQSVVAVTGLIWTPALRAAEKRGALQRQPMFSSIEPDGVRLTDGSLLRADVILWATGFRAELEHLAPLHLRGPGGGIAMDGTQVAAEPRVHLVGYGPSSSTIGANRAGRAAVAAILKLPAFQQ